MILYHATEPSNAGGILTQGLKTSGGVVYLASDPTTAALFLWIKGITQCTVFEVDLPVSCKVEKSDDHNDDYFKSIYPDFGESYFVNDAIPPNCITDVTTIEFS